MALLSEEQKSNVKLVWFNLLQALYSFPPIQRVLLVFGIAAIIPGYWLTRVGTTAYYNWSYSKRAVVAQRSFENPRGIKTDASDVYELSDGRYIAYVKISNPNLELAAPTIPYTIKVLNSNSEQVYSTIGQTFVLPGEVQFVTTASFRSVEEPTTVVFEAGDVHWQKRLYIPEVKLALPAVTYRDSSTGLQLEGSVVNNSPYELGTVRLTFLIQDMSGTIVGVTQRDEKTVKPSTRRTFPQTWPATISASEVSRVISVASTNSLDARNLSVEAGSINRQDSEDN